MKKKSEATQPLFTEWLTSWRNYIRDLPLPDQIDFSEYRYQDFLTKANEQQLSRLLSDVVFSNLLAAAYMELYETRNPAEAQNATRRFLENACWMCNPILNSAHRDDLLDPGDAKKELQRINKAALKLAKQIEDIVPSALRADSVPYLEGRLHAGNPSGYIANRKDPWHNAIHQQPVRRLSELLRCFAGDIKEEAALVGKAIASRRQRGGKHASLHIAMDGLTKASIQLSTRTPPQPNFALVNSVIVALVDPPDGFDLDTVRKRYQADQRRKTHV